MIQNTTTTHDFARDDLEVMPCGEGGARITRYVAFGCLDVQPIFTSIDLSPAQAAFVRDALVNLVPAQEPKS